jgi:hypoxanthine-DNA glycosylase
MGRMFGFKPDSAYEDRVASLVANHVAVWDVIHRCRRIGSMDQAIQDQEPNDLIGWISEHSDVRQIAFNGAKAEETARGCVPELFSTSDLAMCRLPSTSPANASVLMSAKLEAWSQIAKWAASDA